MKCGKSDNHCRGGQKRVGPRSLIARIFLAPPGFKQRGGKGGEMSKGVIFAALFCLFLALLGIFIFGQNPAQEKEPKLIKIIFSKGSLRCEPSKGTVALYAASTFPEQLIVGGGDEWEVQFFSAGIYRLRQLSWGTIFWEVDVMRRQVQTYKESTMMTREPRALLGFEVVPEPGATAFALNFKKMELRFEPAKSQMKLYGDNFFLSTCRDMDRCKVSPQLYHIESFNVRGVGFWKIDLAANQLIYTTGGTFCEVWANERDTAWPDVKVDVKY
jgi:hypothetical protein